MGTTFYFDDEIKDVATGKTEHIEIAVTSAVEGHKIMLRIGGDFGQQFILDEETGRKFCDGVDSAARYLSYT